MQDGQEMTGHSQKSKKDKMLRISSMAALATRSSLCWSVPVWLSRSQVELLSSRSLWSEKREDLVGASDAAPGSASDAAPGSGSDASTAIAVGSESSGIGCVSAVSAIGHQDRPIGLAISQHKWEQQNCSGSNTTSFMLPDN
jgi:hypothetical protein